LKVDNTNFERTLALKASAGSGKTFYLTVRYISILILGGKVENIYSLTFTNKAANEMKERIFSVLSDLKNNEIYLNKIIDITNLEKKEVLSRVEYILKDFMASKHKIMTIDKFCNNILREFSHSLNITSNFSIGNISDRDLKLSFLNFVYKNKNKNDFLKFMDNENLNIDKLFETFSDLYKKDKELKYIREKYSNLNKEQILLEIKLIIKNIEEIVDDLNLIVLKNKNSSKSVLNSFKFNTFEDILKKSWLSKDTLKYRTFNKIWSNELESKFKELKIYISGYFKKKDEYYFTNILNFYDIFKKVSFELKIKSNLLSFDDILNLTYQILNEDEVEKDLLYFKLDSKIDHLLIDEFQDTSYLQYKIFEPIIEEICSGSSNNSSDFSSFFFVGDTKQSIYKFRGSNYKLFDYVKNKFKIKEEDLLFNYRSSKEIVKNVNHIFKERFEDYKEQVAFNEIDKGFVNEYKESPDLMYKRINLIVSELLENGEKPEDICILTFTNKEVVLMKDYLLERFENINISTDTSAKIINQNTIKGISNFIKFLYFKDIIYFENFLSLVNLSIDFEDIKLEEYSFDNVLKLIHKIIDDFKLYEKDQNVYKFLDIVRRFKTIEDFIFSFESIDDSILNKESNGLKIMTIHKSKGLEFKNVILVDSKETKGISIKNNNNIFMNYNELKLFDIEKKYKYREKIDKIFSNKLLYEEFEDIYEFNKLLYVAMTRPKISLSTIINSKKSIIKESLKLMIKDKY